MVGPSEIPIEGTDSRANEWSNSEFSDFYREHSKQVFYLALRFLSDPNRAEDATHDVFVKVFRKLHQFEGRANIKTWLYRITINHCQNLVQAWHHRTMVTNSDDLIWETATAGDETSPIRVLETKELGQQIQTALDGLSEEYRLLLLLVADQDLSYQEIAELTNQSIDSVRGKLHRARRGFQAKFNKLS